MKARDLINKIWGTENGEDISEFTIPLSSAESMMEKYAEIVLKNNGDLGDVSGRFYSKEEIEMIKRECYEDGREEGAYDI